MVPDHQSNSLKKKNNMIIPIDAQKTFGKIQHSFIIKSLIKLLTEKNLKRRSYTKHLQITLYLMGETLNLSPLKSGNKSKTLSHSFYSISYKKNKPVQ